MDHPNLSPEVNAALASVEGMTGLFLKELPAGHFVEARTKNHTYRLSREGCVIGGTYDGWRVNGSTFGGSMIRVDWVGVGMFLEFQQVLDVVVTTAVREINIVREARHEA